MNILKSLHDLLNGRGPAQLPAPNPNAAVGNINGRAYNYGGDFLPTPAPNPLQVVPSGGVQPSQGRQEDDYTATTEAQPVDYNNGQVSLNGGFIQGPQADGQFPNFVNHPNNQSLNVRQQALRRLLGL